MLPSWRPRPPSAAHAREVDATLLDDLYRSSLVSVLGFAAALTILGPLLLEADHASVGWILGLLVAVVVARVALIATDRWGRSRTRSPRFRELAFLAGIAATSLTLAALNVVAYPALPPAKAALLAACQTGAIAAGLGSLGSSAVAFATYAVPNLGSLIAMAALDQRLWGERTLLVLLCVYLPAVLVVSIQQSRVRRRANELELALREEALVDPLTGLFNRRYLQVLVDKEAAVAESSCRMKERRNPARAVVLGILVIDLDHFKRVNDVHGHDAGDDVLREIGPLLKRTVRTCDEIFRWGGEEFVAILRLPEQDRHEIATIAQRMLLTVRRHRFRHGTSAELSCTISVGFVCHPISSAAPGLLPWEASIRLADACLYIAKREGRDRAVGVSAGPRMDARLQDAAKLTGGNLREAAAAEVVTLTTVS